MEHRKMVFIVVFVAAVIIIALLALSRINNAKYQNGYCDIKEDCYRYYDINQYQFAHCSTNHNCFLNLPDVVPRYPGPLIRIESASGTANSSNITIRNIGDSEIKQSEILIFINNQTITTGISWMPDSNNLTARAYASILIAGIDCSGQKVKVIIHGNADQVTCI